MKPNLLYSAIKPLLLKRAKLCIGFHFLPKQSYLQQFSKVVGNGGPALYGADFTIIGV